MKLINLSATLIYGMLSLGLLFYMLAPSPASIQQISALPDSLKSTEPGDTVQVPNIAAYYSNLYRKDVVNFYQNEIHKKVGLPIPPIRINHPPEYAYSAIKDQTRSTYLEEIVYPLKVSLFVNGFEPHYEDGTPKYRGATDIIVDGVKFNTKTTLRIYPQDMFSAIATWLGINLSVLLVIIMFFKIVLGKEIRIIDQWMSRL